MMTEDDSPYYARRAGEEWKAAENASILCAAIAHAKLARLYEARAQRHRADEIVRLVSVV